MAYAKAKHFRKLGTISSFMIEEVYLPYFVQEATVNDKFSMNTYKVFPKAIKDAVVTSADPRLKDFVGKKLNKENKELRLQTWNKNIGVFEFSRVKMNKDTYKTLKKVFDVKVITGENISIPVWNKELGQEAPLDSNEWVFSGVSSAKVRGMIEDLDLDVWVPTMERTSKDGEKYQGKVYDWEDETSQSLKGVFIKARVDGVGMDTKYKFKEGKEFSIKKKEESPLPKDAFENDPFDKVDDIPFN